MDSTSNAYVTAQTVLNGPVVLAPYDPAWPLQFDAQAAKVRLALGAAVEAHHAGSSASSLVRNELMAWPLP